MPIAAFVVAGFVEFRRNSVDIDLVSYRQKFTIEKVVSPEYQRLNELDPSVRINIMLCVPLFTKQRLFSFRRDGWMPRLSYFERFGFVEDDADRNIVIRKGEGVAGMALHHELPAIGQRDSNRIIVGSVDRNVARYEGDERAVFVVHGHRDASPHDSLRAIANAEVRDRLRSKSARLGEMRMIASERERNLKRWIEGRQVGFGIAMSGASLRSRDPAVAIAVGGHTT